MKIPPSARFAPDRGIFIFAMRTRNWSFLVYPESAPDNWIDCIAAYHFPFAISPLHDRDFDKDGNPKKPHYHVLLTFDSVKSLDQIKSLSALASNVLPIPVHSVYSMFRYFVHADDPDKFQYDPSTIRCLCGFIPPLDDLTADSTLREIINYLYVHNVCFFARFASYCLTTSNWLYYLKRYTSLFARIIDSNRFETYGKNQQVPPTPDRPLPPLS